jgi:hypothetical protein
MIVGMIFSQASFSQQASQVTLPKSLVANFQAYFEDTPFPCGRDAVPSISHGLVNAKNELLLYIKIPNYLCDHHMVVEVFLDHNQKWKELSAWEGRLADVFSTSLGLLALSHWEIEGTYPRLLFRTDGTSWQPIPLPKDRYQDCCFERVNSMSVFSDTLLLQMYKEDTVLPFWQLPLKELLTSSSITGGAAVPWTLASNIKQPAQSIQSGSWQPLDIHKQSDTLYKLMTRVKKNEAHWLIILPVLRAR